MKKIILLLIIATTSQSMLSYTWTVENRIGRTAQVTVNASGQKITKKIAPGKKETFAFGGWKKGLCFTSISVDGKHIKAQAVPKLKIAEFFEEGTGVEKGLKYTFAPLASPIIAVGALTEVIMDVCSDGEFILAVDDKNEVRAIRPQ